MFSRFGGTMEEVLNVQLGKAAGAEMLVYVQRSPVLLPVWVQKYINILKLGSDSQLVKVNYYVLYK